jgi:plasmid stabilization system protein ParE
MAASRVEIHPSALAELKSAVTWYMQRNEAAVLNFASELDRALTLIVSAPRRWPAGEHHTRKFVLQRFPYAIFYREREDAIQIVAIAHGSRRPWYWKDRL